MHVVRALYILHATFDNLTKIIATVFRIFFAKACHSENNSLTIFSKKAVVIIIFSYMGKKGFPSQRANLGDVSSY